ncbi:hypothetical protein X762_03320 [Mesorhizobium sp. LSHC426A00]|nr:hypothetical protein X762_03320 [Mesorhizobium sp. LSHC426A00]ESX59279.1 hypothetical protein X761_01455 [Mesorhizobium sp. LSHC424B00]ESX76554.1 hypothetical protein X758_02330 [Mesorhizobium sp. LSHC416B00]
MMSAALFFPSLLVGEGGSARSAETDEGCSGELQRLTPLEHPSSVAFGDTFSHRERREGCAS